MNGAILILLFGTACAQTLIKFNTSDWLAVHNEVRRLQPASNMQELVWDQSLAKLAENWVQKCEWGHSPGNVRDNGDGYKFVGENLLVVTFPQPDAAYFRQHWFEWEERNYNPWTKNCWLGQCRHYTQMIWAETCAVGCAMAKCPYVHYWGHSGYYVACNYGPAGNWVGEAPYKSGKPCSDCPGKCNNRLCESQCKKKEPVWKRTTKKWFYNWTTKTAQTTKPTTTKSPWKKEQRPKYNYFKDEHCDYSKWTRWSRCSAKCGKGLRTASRRVRIGDKASCTYTFQSIPCIGQNCS